MIFNRKLTNKIDFDGLISKIQNNHGKPNFRDNYTFKLKKDEKITVSIEISFHKQKPVRETLLSCRGLFIPQNIENNDKIIKIDEGILFLTNKRLIFIGRILTEKIDFKKLKSIESNENGIIIQRNNRNYKEYYRVITK